MGITSLSAQLGTISGVVKDQKVGVDFATIYIKELDKGANTEHGGNFKFEKVPFGTYQLSISFIGYEQVDTTVTVSGTNPTATLTINLASKLMVFDEVVVTGTKTFKRQTKSAVIVNVVDGKTLDNVQACNLSEGLRFQPGLRVETDCQTCNYTQLRMNGLAGGYAQILINGRPIFSPLTGLYGMEQLPTNMIDRLEVIRGGGSSLYGSSAVGGTVNVITKVPKNNGFEVNQTFQKINQTTDDILTSLNGTIMSPSKKIGIAVFMNNRKRGLYDHNQDNFSELPSLKNFSLGSTLFYLPSETQKLEVSFSRMYEYRYGGEMKDVPPHETAQSEERTHKVYMGNLDYQINFNQDRTSFIAYLAGQYTDRQHYTGIFPDTEEEILNHLANPPYGTSLSTTYQGGFQLNHSVDQFLKGKNVFTFGGEYVVDDTYDEIEAYRYLIDQKTQDLGLFLQSDWEILPSLNLLSGVRIDQHNLVENLVVSPRASILYKLKENTQFRLSYGTGFRAPQAFDTDLHIAFAGGGISRVMLALDLKPENSQSFSASINYDKPTEEYVAGFTLEAFHTQLKDAFNLTPIGTDQFGELFEKRNAQNATVQGVTLELRANYNRQVQVEGGYTLQTSTYEKPVTYIEGLEAIKAFTRTPNQYGFANLTITPGRHWNANINYVYTGSMILPHFSGAPNQTLDEYVHSESFSEVNVKLGYKLPLNKLKSNIELYAGIKNILNAYQDDFDIGKYRDSNFIYGPSLPRTLFFGVKWIYL
ncbi:TonB-dependent receptor [Portibacter lacus]|uniref:TonB-dependent receptor n=2 Tax=Portibacter lacus TaxID=1099794 RepID=A0AA37WE60_9BACT|nr:TonB-dependent receptor [Portibacter lacus]